MPPVPRPARSRVAVRAVAAFRAGLVLPPLLLLGACSDGGEADRARPSDPAPSSVPAPISTPPAGPDSTVAGSAAPDPAAVVLSPEGLGNARFGDDGASVLAVLTDLLGPPVDDRTLGTCASGDADRLVQFSELGVLLDGPAGRQQFVGWDVGPPSGALPPLATAEGIGVGSTRLELQNAFGTRLQLDADDPFGPSFDLPATPPAGLTGTLTGPGPDDTVATLQGGSASC